MLPVIFGLAGTALSADERDFFKAADPAGFILFARNVDHPAQLRALTDDLRALTGRDVDGVGAATLAAELHAARVGADYVRTHDVGALRDGLQIEAALDEHT